jgi:WD40 repeat protein
LIYLDHTSTIHLPDNCHIWQEQVTAASKRTYQQIHQPYSPPTGDEGGKTTILKTGISLLAFNSNGSMIATKDEATPTAVWIWNLTSLSPTAVLIHHSPVKSISWHPHQSDLLLISCSQDETVLNLWNNTTAQPAVIPISAHKTSARLDIRWLGGSTKSTAILAGDSKRAIIIWPNGKSSDESIGHFDEGESVDSVYEALIGPSPQKTGFKSTDDTELLMSEMTEDFTGVVDDTFVNRKQMMV